MRHYIARVFCLLVLAGLVALPAAAQCAYYECTRAIDTATCWERYGPNAKKFRFASECKEVASCTWYHFDGQWQVSCSYNCQTTNCYEV